MRVTEYAPGTRLAGATVLGLLVIGFVLWLAVSRPWLGLTLMWDAGTQSALVLASRGPSGNVPPGTALVGIRSPQQAHSFVSLDFAVEPDGNLGTYRDYDLFLRNQGVLATIQGAPSVTLLAFDGTRHQVQPRPTRPLATFPIDFWIQLAVGLLAWMIASAVWAFRPYESSARYLLLNGATTLSFAPAAAVYTTRELAVPLPELLLLKGMNFGGGLLFCASMVALMLVYPRPIARRGLGILIIVAYVAWFIAQAMGAFESMMIARRAPVFAALLALVILAIVQWRRSSRDPVARAALRWFMLSWLIGMGLFVLLIMVPQIIEADTGALQGYSFLLFLVIYGGIALGILRFRLFDLGLWWFRAVAWITGAVVLVVLDLLFLFGMHFSSEWSLSISLLICALLWLPFRNWLWGRCMRTPPPPGSLFKSVVHVALAPTSQDRATRWEALLQSLFNPLEIRPAGDVEQVFLAEDGASLCLPSVAQSNALELRYPDTGRRLFTSADRQLARYLTDMLRYAEESREAYVQGAREERSRIARDLHDDIGALLLTGMHQPDLPSARESMAQAINEMRVILRGLAGERQALATLQADLRHEMDERLQMVGITLDWQDCNPDVARTIWLDYKSCKSVLSAMREVISNVIRHARASRVQVAIALQDGHIVLDVSDDGCGFGADPGREGGYGLDSLRQRIQSLGGTVNLVPLGQGTRVTFCFPLHQNRSVTGTQGLDARDPLSRESHGL